MGRASRLRPVRLAQKLLQIRNALDLSQNEMVSRLGFTETLYREDISAFERGKREPPLPLLLAYARAVGISTDVLIDDEMDLPGRLLKAPKSAGIKRKPAVRTKRRR